MNPAVTPPVVIVGIGNPMRGDDGIGPAAIAELERAAPAQLDGDPELVVLDGEPTRLIDVWRDRTLAIVIDAARSDTAAAGSIHRVELGRDPLPPWVQGSSSHSAGLAEAVDLGRALGRLPHRLVVFGVEPHDLSLGEGLSPAVAAALPALVERVAIEAAR